MSHDSASAFLSRQQTMFRLAERGGVSRKIICLSTGYSRTAVDEWARGEKAMSGPAMVALASMPELPAELLSLLFDGTGRHVADDSGEHGDLDALGCETAGFTADYCEAKRDGTITPLERNKLKAAAARIANTAGKVAA